MNTHKRFEGILPALPTPYDESGAVNGQALAQLIRYNLAKGVAGFYVCGSTAEVFLLEPEEREEIYRLCAAEARGKAALIAHVGDFSLARAVRYAKLCESLGYSAVSAVTPFYYNYSAEQIVAYYQALADAVSLPVLLYHIPACAGVTLERSAFDELLSDERCLGVKFTGNDYFTFERLRERYPEKILYNGYDEMCLCGLAMGADGAIGTTYNLMAEKFIGIHRRCLNNDFVGARTIQHEANDIIECMLAAGDVKAALKYAISTQVGIPMGICRAPGGGVSREWAEMFDARFGGAFVPYRAE